MALALIHESDFDRRAYDLLDGLNKFAHLGTILLVKSDQQPTEQMAHSSSVTSLGYGFLVFMLPLYHGFSIKSP